MTHEELIEEQHLLEKAVKYAFFEISQGVGNKVIAKVSHSFEDKTTNDWLSAMINGFVDIAKDPYIVRLNVNAWTYNMVS